MKELPRDFPAVSRRRVRRALRAEREAAGWSQGEVARRLEWSLSKMQRIETGEVTVSGTDLRALLDLYGVTDPDRVAALMEDSRIARRERYWVPGEFREYLPPGLVQLVQYESVATAIRAYQPHLVPGLLQTTDVAKAVLDWWAGETAEAGDGVRVLDETATEARRSARLWRQRLVLGREDPPEYSVLLDESVIQRVIGGPGLMADQLDHLATVGGNSNVRIRLIPADSDGIIGMAGPFTIIELGSGDAVLYRENDTRDSLSEDADRVAVHQKRFERSWLGAFDEEESHARITSRASWLRSSTGGG
ncbi:helix-turn-helix transcriptional regulator [Actinoplanes sp. NPDC051861]|uniref:helix-turn-helix domain-containing protein n=1 Tax=Actinoplanes sp. NPDC051861 TaxID=3155170 RepID=UPI00341B7D4A